MLLWSITSLFLTCAYNSNLRAHLFNPSLEKKILVPQDIIQNKAKVWIPHYMSDPNKPDDIHFWALERITSVLQDYVSDNLNSYLDNVQDVLPDEVWNDVQENRAVVMTSFVSTQCHVNIN